MGETNWRICPKTLCRAGKPAPRADEGARVGLKGHADGPYAFGGAGSAAATNTQGRIWTYIGDEQHPYTVYDYTISRGRDGPDEFLKEFSGFLQADAYSGYDELYEDPARGIVEVACWAHTRRKFFEAQSSDLMRSMVMLANVRLLYDVERKAHDMKLDSEGRRALRQAKSALILDDIKAYLEWEHPKVLTKSPEGQAIAYALSNRKALVRHCEDGDLEIDHNGA